MVTTLSAKRLTEWNNLIELTLMQYAIRTYMNEVQFSTLFWPTSSLSLSVECTLLVQGTQYDSQCYHGTLKSRFY